MYKLTWVWEIKYSCVKGSFIECRSLWAVKYIYLKEDKGKFALKGNQLTIVLFSQVISFTANTNTEFQCNRLCKNILDCSGSLGQYDFL